MGGVAVIGEQVTVQGWALAGAAVFAADNPSAVAQAWRSLQPDVCLVILTPAAAEHLSDQLAGQGWPMTVVMPQ